MGRKRLLILFISFLISSNFPGAVNAENAQPTPGSNIVTIEIHYHSPEAGKVNFVWGINGWQSVPEELHTEGSIIQNDLLVTPMRRDGETFVAEIQVPIGFSVQYGFTVTETADGRIVDVWDKGIDPRPGKPKIPPILIATYDKNVFNVDADVNLNPPFVTQTFHYRHSDASEVVLVWGINGWMPVTEAASSVETTIKDDLMHTRMVRSGDIFQASIQVPKDSTVQYGFSLAGQEDMGSAASGWDGGSNYYIIANVDRSVKVDAWSGTSQTVADEVPLIMSLISEYWPLLLVGICIVLGIVIGFRNS
jgi:hypothetical protein